jgi:hypothetical protein
MTEHKSLAAKMAAIMGDVPTMIKNGQNIPQKYLYVTAEDVKAAIRPLLKKHKVAVFSSMVDVQRDTAINRNNTTVVTVLAKMRFTVVCGETGETMECEWYGEANDYADKAVNKAATAAEKYWLINTFLLSTTEPDADEETIESAAPLPMSAEQYTTISTKGKALYGNEWAKVAKELVHQFSTQRTFKATEMTEAEAEDLLRYLENEEMHANATPPAPRRA